jgi:methyl-accepting chemotaxis protein
MSKDIITIQTSVDNVEQNSHENSASIELITKEIAGINERMDDFSALSQHLTGSASLLKDVLGRYILKKEF